MYTDSHHFKNRFIYILVIKNTLIVKNSENTEMSKEIKTYNFGYYLSDFTIVNGNNETLFTK